MDILIKSFLWLNGNFMRENLAGQYPRNCSRYKEENGINNPDFLKRANQLQNWVKTIPAVTNTRSLIDVIKDLNKYLNDRTKNIIAFQITHF